MATRQRSRRRRKDDAVHVEEDEQSDLEDIKGRAREPARNTWTELSNEEQSKYVKRLVRYFLARNYEKTPIKRPELTKALLEDQEGRIHPKVFTGALTKSVAYLKGKFGFQIMQVRRFTKSGNTQRSQRSQTTFTQSQTSGPVGEKGYIMINMIEGDKRPEMKDTAEVTTFGLIIVVATMVLLEPGARISQEKLYQSLERLGLNMSGREYDNHKDLGNLKDLLEHTLTKQWYFERERIDQDKYQYLIGPRLLHELTEEHLLAFISAVYGTPLDQATRTELKERFKSMREQSDDEESD